MAQERAGAVTMRGNPLTLVGPELKVGEAAPAFTLIGAGMKPVSLADYKGKVKIISTIPSVDTPVCDAETRRYKEEAAKLTADVVVMTFSMYMKFAQSRWCGAAGVDKVTTLSDYRGAHFGESYGVLIKELFLLARVVFVLDKNDKIVHVEYVKEVANQPDFESTLEAARKAAA